MPVAGRTHVRPNPTARFLLFDSQTLLQSQTDGVGAAGPYAANDSYEADPVKISPGSSTTNGTDTSATPALKG